MERTTPAPYVATLRKRGFELGDYVGGGAYGSVYSAVQASLGRRVAVKFFDRRTAAFAANRKRFNREAPLLARVQHPAIPYVITTGAVPGDQGEVPYSVMQFVEGATLEQRLSEGRVPVELVRRVMADVLAALACAHTQGVIHRDVKPSNIILSDHSIYLIDFSIGFCLEAVPGLSRATVVGERIGTWDYAAPEQLADASSVGQAADIYSAGAVLAEMLGARPRIKHATLDAELSACSRRLRDLVRLATHDDALHRVATAREFRGQLLALLGEATGDWLERRLVLCATPGCGAGAWSNNGTGDYFWGPSIQGPTEERHCRGCGAEYLRGCPGCSRPFPDDLRDLVVKRSKPSRDPIEAYCSGCGSLIHRTPTCARCGSYLTKSFLGKDTARGCEKCIRKQGRSDDTRGDWPDSPTTSPGADDGDIPF